MKTSLKFSIFACVIIVASAFGIKPTQAADCILTSGGWSVNSVNLGTTITVQIQETGCNGVIIRFNFFGKSGGTTFPIDKGSYQIFAGTSGPAIGYISFTQADFQGKTGDIQVYYTAQSAVAGSTPITSSFLTILPVNAATCSLANVIPSWTKGAVNIGDTVTLGISAGSGCVGQSALIDLYEEDPLADDYIRTIPVTFVVGVTSVNISFTAADYAKGGNESNYEDMYADIKFNPDNGPHAKSSIIKLSSSVGCGGTGQPACVPGAVHGVKITSFDISPKQIAINATGNILFTYKLSVSDPATAKHYCSDSSTFIWYVYATTDAAPGEVRSSPLPWPSSPKDYNLDFEYPYTAGHVNSTVNVSGVVKCSSGGLELDRYPSVPLTVGTGGPGGGCGGAGQPACPPGGGGGATQLWACVADNNVYSCTTDTSATASNCSGGNNTACNGKSCVQINKVSCSEQASWACVPKGASSATQYSCSMGNKKDCSDITEGCSGACVQVPQSACGKSYSYNITNPLAGGPNDLFSLINIVTQWIMYIAIPLAVLWIMYAGFLMLTAGPTPANFQKGRDILKYTVLGLAIIFIGKGFVSLIISVIELGGATPTTQTGGPGGGTGSLGGMGWTCSSNSDCNSGLKCQNTMCASVNGNIAGEPCLDNQCAQGLVCDNSGPSQKVIDGRTVGSCFQALCQPKDPYLFSRPSEYQSVCVDKTTTSTHSCEKTCVSGSKAGTTCYSSLDCQ